MAPMLSIYPAPTFVSLPLEIKIKIYGLLLISSDPITVYTGRRRVLSPRGQRQPRGTYPKVAAVTFGLLQVNRIIADEAAAVFYHHTVFRFCEFQEWPLAEPWDPLYSFLLIIGDKNRPQLRYLEAQISRPMEVAKDACGTAFSALGGSKWMRKVHARENARTYCPVMDGEDFPLAVDYVSPAIEAVFRILGSEGSRLQLLLHLEVANVPVIDSKISLISDICSSSLGVSASVPSGAR
ncbi:hypothetical protein LOCC1_G003459 [Lachnellula occidentalis]|uniref:Uncharacterized protein n=1 Tax=Lachnellula occidentalis TaxID=215460 RepID=A0A8H8UFE6_9HELO|nr:hypothetical protein LOCC1_G003459 [Lachnellula occidentalis]